MDVLIVRLNRESSLERARTLQRNFVGHYIAKLDHDETVDAVLAPFTTKMWQTGAFLWCGWNICLERGARRKS